MAVQFKDDGCKTGLEMQSAMISRVRRCDRPSKFLSTCAAMFGLAAFAMTVLPASALTGANRVLQQQLKQDGPVIEVRARGGGVAVRGGGAVRRTTVVGPRGGAASRTVVRPGRFFPSVVRPGRIEAAACAGRVRQIIAGLQGRSHRRRGSDKVVTAATAAAPWAGSPPAPGMLLVLHRYLAHRQGFWDLLPSKFPLSDWRKCHDVAAGRQPAEHRQSEQGQTATWSGFPAAPSAWAPTTTIPKKRLSIG